MLEPLAGATIRALLEDEGSVETVLDQHEPSASIAGGANSHYRWQLGVGWLEVDSFQ
jgi:hypothetical protein